MESGQKLLKESRNRAMHWRLSQAVSQQCPAIALQVANSRRPGHGYPSSAGVALSLSIPAQAVVVGHHLLRADVRRNSAPRTAAHAGIEAPCAGGLRQRRLRFGVAGSPRRACRPSIQPRGRAQRPATAAARSDRGFLDHEGRPSARDRRRQLVAHLHLRTGRTDYAARYHLVPKL